jgi:hypothetical protein
MKFTSALAIVAAASQASAFVVVPNNGAAVTTTTTTTTQSSSSSSALNMGMLDFFSEEARQKREAKKDAEVEEQLRLQAEIYERRKNPEKMEEYEQKVMMRRQLRMQGKDDEASDIAMYDGDAEKLKPTST